MAAQLLQLQDGAASTETLCESAGQLRHMDLDTKVKNFSLNKDKSLQKKRDHCGRPFINVIPRDAGRQIKIECSTGCYELLKTEIIQLVKDEEFGKKFGLFIHQEAVTDLDGNSPELIIKATNRLKTGAQGKFHKFTINLYHTQCSLLINGNATPLLNESILPMLLKKLESNPKLTLLDKMYAEVIDRCLAKSIEKPDHSCAQALPSQHTTEEPKAAPLQDNMTILELSSDDLDSCRHCNQIVEHGIACDNCHQWYHFSCESLDQRFAAFYDEKETPYSCLSCRHLTVYLNETHTSLDDPPLALDQGPVRVDEADELPAGSDIQTELQDTPPPIYGTVPSSDVTPRSSLYGLDGHIQSETVPASSQGQQTPASISLNVIPTTVTPNPILTTTPFLPTSGKLISSRDDGPLKKNNTEAMQTTKDPPSSNLNPTQKKATRKRNSENPIPSDLQQQLDFSSKTIQTMEKKIEDLERRNRLLELKTYTSQPEVRVEETANSCHAPSSDAVTLQRINNLEHEIIRTRLAHLESMQQLSLQMNMMAFQNLQSLHMVRPLTAQHPMMNSTVPMNPSQYFFRQPYHQIPSPFPPYPAPAPNWPYHVQPNLQTPNLSHHQIRPPVPPNIGPSMSVPPYGLYQGQNMTVPENTSQMSSSRNVGGPGDCTEKTNRMNSYVSGTTPLSAPGNVTLNSKSTPRSRETIKPNRNRSSSQHSNSRKRQYYAAPRLQRQKLYRSSFNHESVNQQENFHSTPKQVRFESDQNAINVSDLSQESVNSND